MQLHVSYVCWFPSPPPITDVLISGWVMWKTTHKNACFVVGSTSENKNICYWKLSPRHDRGNVLRNSQWYGCLNKSSIYKYYFWELDTWVLVYITPTTFSNSWSLLCYFYFVTYINTCMHTCIHNLLVHLS